MSLFPSPPLVPHLASEPSKLRPWALAPILRALQPTGRDNTVDERTRRSQIADAKLKNATSFDDWLSAAEDLDELEGNDEWKADPVSEDYDYGLLEMRLKELDQARLNCDVGRMLYLIRTTLSRNLGDMGNIRLYQHSHTGTKHLIEEYISSCLETIATLVSTSRPRGGPTNRYIMEALIATRQAFGRTALLLSGGSILGMNHIGVLKALFEADLLPRVISGASAGSIVASVLCTSTDDEIPKILEEFPYGDLAVFEDANKPENVFHRTARFLKIGAWIDIQHLIRVMRGILGDITFQEAYNRTRRILNICVSSPSEYELPRILNYISSPNVLVWSAVAASCSAPILFSSAPLLIKDRKTGQPVPWNPSPQRWIDGSVDNDLPMARLSEMFNVNHFIVSQVNPHVAPFLSYGGSALFGQTVVKLAMTEAMHRMTVLAEMGIFRTSLTKVKCILSQKYSGDITILPEISYKDFGRILKNPSSNFMLRAALSGERATWPKMSQIRNHCAIELALDKAIHMLRTRVVFSPSQTDLRSALSGRPRGRRRRIRSSDGMSLRGSFAQNSRSRSEVDQKWFGIRKTSDTVLPVKMPVIHRVRTSPPSKSNSPTESEDSSESSDESYFEDAPRPRTKPPTRISMPTIWNSAGSTFNLFMTPSNPTSPDLRKSDGGHVDAVARSAGRMSIGGFDFGIGLGIGRAKSAEELRQAYIA